VLFGKFRYTDRGILDNTHVRFYTERSAREMIAAAGYRVTTCTGAIPVPLIRQRHLCALAHRIGNLRRSLFAYNFVITAVPQ
jgi:hypothetical protein